MTSVRIWGIGCGIGVVAVLAGGFFLGVQPALASASQIDQQTSALTGRNQASMLTLAALSKQGAKVSDMQAQEKVLMKAVPQILKPNTFIRRVTEVAAIDNVTVEAITPSEAVAYTVPDSAARPAAAGGGADGPAPAGTAAATTEGAPALAATDPTITSTNFAAVPVVVQVSGSQSALLQFAHDIQTDQRLFLISAIASATDATGKSTTSLTGYIYALQR